MVEWCDRDSRVLRGMVQTKPKTVADAAKCEHEALRADAGVKLWSSISHKIV